MSSSASISSEWLLSERFWRIASYGDGMQPILRVQKMLMGIVSWNIDIR
jgi:hypothetical protein